jgi:hypothetical protein
MRLAPGHFSPDSAFQRRHRRSFGPDVEVANTILEFLWSCFLHDSMLIV